MVQTVQRWELAVTLDGVDISPSLVGDVEIVAEETASATARVRFLPGAGVLSLEGYENKPLTIAYRTLDAGGGVLTSTPRFTGTSARASFDPDPGLVTIEATNDLQGAVEALDRAGIDALIGAGSWSEHVFDPGADPWQYALDVLSTTPAEMHVDASGALVVVDWAAKPVADVTLTDAERFADTLRLRRVTRTDLITRARIDFDFRFTRLRHREIAVNFAYSPGICGYLDGEATVPQRAMIQAATDANSWVRVSDITFVDFPDTGTICGGKTGSPAARNFSAWAPRGRPRGAGRRR